MKSPKAQLSAKIMELLLKEQPIQKMLNGSAEEADEYIDVVTDSMSSVMARLTAAYLTNATMSNPDMSEDEMFMIEERIHDKFSRHVDFEIGNLAEKIKDKIA